MVSVTAGGVIGWDNVEDNNSSPSVTGQIAVSPNDRAAIYVNGIYGPEQTCFPAPGAFQSGCNRNKRGVVDVVGNFKLTDDLGLIMNFDWGSEDEASVVNPGRHSTWVGAGGVLTYQFTNRFSTAVRGEWFSDAQGSRTGVQQDLWDVTFDFKAMLSEYIYTRVEYRPRRVGPAGLHRAQDHLPARRRLRGARGRLLLLSTPLDTSDGHEIVEKGCREIGSPSFFLLARPARSGSMRAPWAFRPRRPSATPPSSPIPVQAHSSVGRQQTICEAAIEAVERMAVAERHGRCLQARDTDTRRRVPCAFVHQTLDSTKPEAVDGRPR